MELQNRLEHATQIVKELNVECEPDEIVQIANDVGEKDLVRVAKVVTYVRKRFLEGANMVESFKAAFPERCVVKDTREVARWGGSKKEGEPLSKSAIEIKARRLENSKLYKAVVTLLNTSLYVSYALERMKVLDHALEKIFDDRTTDRNKVEFMKVFLQETRKPEKTGELEVNVNIQNNDISVVNIENKLSDIAKKLEGKSGKEIIDIVGGSN